MARWSRSRLRTFGVGAVAFLGGSLLVIPAVSQAGDEPAAGRPAVATAAAATPDRIATVAGKRGRSAFAFQPGSGDRNAPFSFVSTGGTVRVQQLGGAHPPVQAKTGAPVRAARAAAAETTYPTTLTVDSQNWTAWNKSIGLWNRDTWTYMPVPVTNPANSLSATASLPPGNYYVTAMYGIYGYDSYLLTKAFTVTNKAQTVHLDEKSAKEVAITVDDSTARQDMSAVWMALPNGDLVGFAGGPRTRTYVTTASLTGTTLRVHELLTKAGSTALKPSPYRYDLVQSWPHPLPASPIATVKTASLAKTTTTIRAQGVTTDGTYLTVPSFGEWTGAFLPTSVRVPATITEYVSPGVTMSRLVYYGDSQQSLSLSDRTLPAGTSAGETVGAGPLAPSRRPGDDDSRRDLNRLQITENMSLGDAAGNKGTDNSSTTSMTLSSGGQVLKTAKVPSMSVNVLPDRQTYLLDQTTTRKVGWSQLSTKIRSEWTFASAGPVSATLPLMDLAIAASGLDQRNRAGSAPVGLTVEPATRVTATSTVDKVEWSVDDGGTWTEAPLSASGDGVTASLDVPATAAFVSLRVSASNDQGGALRRTVLRALAGPGTAGDDSVGGTTISNVQVNGATATTGSRPAVPATATTAPVVAGTSGTVGFIATFTATDPSGIAGGGVYLWHGDYNTPDGLATTRTVCAPMDATTSHCTAYGNIWDVRYSLPSNALAAAWRVEAWASAKDGTGFTDRRSVAGVQFSRATALTADATPDPVAKGKTITVAGALTRADWDSGTDKPYGSQTVTLRWANAKTSNATILKTVQADANGKLKTTVPAVSDGSYRFSFAGDATSGLSSSVPDPVIVQ